MNLEQALDILIARTGHERYRWLCSEDNPDVIGRDAYRALVITQAEGKPTQDPAEVLGSEALRAYLADHPCGGC
jgi:hypothetical protein